MRVSECKEIYGDFYKMIRKIYRLEFKSLSIDEIKIIENKFKTKDSYKYINYKLKFYFDW